MPIYENRSNAENLLRLPQEKLLDIVCGCDAGAEKIAGTVKNKSVILCESWYGENHSLYLPQISSDA